jgi:hypothetical protein
VVLVEMVLWEMMGLELVGGLLLLLVLAVAAVLTTVQLIVKQIEA